MGSRVKQDGGAQELLRREADDGTSGADGGGSAGALAKPAGARAGAMARPLDSGQPLAEPARGGRGRGRRARVPVRGRARGSRRPHLRVGLQLLRGVGRAHLRAAQLRTPAPRWLAAASQDPARALPSGAGSKGAICSPWRGPWPSLRSWPTGWSNLREDDPGAGSRPGRGRH